MKIFKKIYFGIKLFYLISLKKQVGKFDYKDEYNGVAPTYELWLEKMHKYIDEIIHLEFFKDKPSAAILDFACGTGYITEQLLNNLSNPEFKIIGVDISEKMIEEANKNILDPRGSFVLQDGLEFLEDEIDNFYDAIFCGYALPYFRKKHIVPQFFRVLKDKGTLHLILNSQGTLEGIKEIYMSTMKDYPFKLKKFMNIRSQLPKDEETFQILMEKYGFETVEIKTVNEVIKFSSPEELYLWLKQTGAIAGTGKIFVDDKMIERAIIEKIRESLYYEGEYRINHKFIQGIFRKPERS